MANTITGTYTETMYVVANDGTTAFRIEALLDTVDVDQGDKESEFKPNLAGGRVEILKPQEDTVVTFEGWFMGVGDTDDATPDGMISLFAGTTADATVPFSVDVDRTRRRFTLFLLWTDDSVATIATGSIASGANALRMRAGNARLVSLKPSYTDKELKFTFKFRIPAFNPSGTRNITWESTDGTASMETLATIAA